MTSLSLLFPVGRVVQGSLYVPQEKDQQGNPLVIKTGPNKGQPTKKYFFALATPKAPGETHWAQTAWGQQMWALAHAAWPQGQANSPSFAFKVEDGDSVVPNKKGRKNSEREGFPGNWIVGFSSSFAPKIVTASGDPILEPGAVKLGYFVEVLGSIASNENSDNPGIYVNHTFVALRGFGPEITTGPDARSVGFGKSALPAGASAAPVGVAAFPALPQPTAVAPAPVMTAVAPAPSFIAPPPPPQPIAVSVPVAPVGPVMTPKAAGQSYAAFISAGWNDGTLRSNGYMV